MFPAYAVMVPQVLFSFELSHSVSVTWASLLTYFLLLAFASIYFLIFLPNSGPFFWFYILQESIIFFYLLTMKIPMCSNLFFLCTQSTYLFIYSLGVWLTSPLLFYSLIYILSLEFHLCPLFYLFIYSTDLKHVFIWISMFLGSRIPLVITFLFCPYE